MCNTICGSRMLRSYLLLAVIPRFGSKFNVLVFVVSKVVRLWRLLSGRHLQVRNSEFSKAIPEMAESLAQGEPEERQS